MKKLLKIGYWIFVGAVLALGLLLVATLIPVPGGIEIKIVQSGSMSPTVPTGSVVVVQPTDEYEVGDIITFGEDTRSEVPTTHRIVDIEVIEGEYRYTTKGDANEDSDAQSITEDEIVGKMLISIPFLGYILDFARQPAGFLILVLIPAAIVVFDELQTIYTELQKKDKQKSE